MPLCLGNHVLRAFDAHNLYVSISPMVLLYQGCREMFAIPLRLHALFVTDSSLYLWHCRLGHPSTKVMSYLDSNKLLSSTIKFKSSFHIKCNLGKSTRNPFSVSKEIIISFPGILVHFDV